MLISSALSMIIIHQNKVQLIFYHAWQYTMRVAAAMRTTCVATAMRIMFRMCNQWEISLVHLHWESTSIIKLT